MLAGTKIDSLLFNLDLKSTMRLLREDEKRLMNCLLNNSVLVNINLDLLNVEEMNDGGMGGLYFVSPQKAKSERRFGKCISERQFSDSDNIPILISVNVDEAGDLFELDIWKVDYSPLIRIPECEKANNNNF
jgi:hypothetical protein